jgi:hypothetical protein
MARSLLRRFVVTMLSVAALTLAPRAAGAGVIVGVGASVLPPGSSASFTFAPPLAPNNDDATAPSPNVSVVSKTYGSPGTLDFEYFVSNSGGTTEYFVDEALTGILNLSMVPWSGYTLRLGFGVGDAFIPSGPMDFLDFDAPDRDPAPTANAFATLAHLSNDLLWSDGIVASGGTLALTFSMDVPDHNAGIPAGFERRNTAGNIVGYRFTLRQTPTAAAVAEPASGLLLAVGVAGITRSRRRG